MAGMTGIRMVYSLHTRIPHESDETYTRLATCARASSGGVPTTTKAAGSSTATRLRPPVSRQDSGGFSLVDGSVG
jgi:hypothetical protein